MLNSETISNIPVVGRRLAIISYLAQKRIKRKLKGLSGKPEVVIIKCNEDDYDSHIVDDMPLTITRDPYPGSSFHQEHAS